MTYFEKLFKEHPECIDPARIAGCEGCPSSYGYESVSNAPCNKSPELFLGDFNCTKCWNREIQTPITENDDSSRANLTQQMDNITQIVNRIIQKKVKEFEGEEKKQEAKADKGKLKLSLVPSQIIRDIACIREYGTKKYHDPGNWKKVEVERYRDAAYRHLLAYIEDPHGNDDESGLPHLWHLACNIAFLCELEHPNLKGVNQNETKQESTT